MGAYLFTALGRGEVGGTGLTASLKFATSFFIKKDFRIHSFPNTMNTELACTLGTCPSMGSAEWVNAFWKTRGYLITRVPHSTREMAPLEIQLICIGQALVTRTRRCD